MDKFIKNNELIKPCILRTEVNFIKYPFFSLEKKNKRDIIEIVEKIESNKGTTEIYWKVVRPFDDSLPGAFDKKLYRAIEHIINELPRPIKNPIRLGSLRDICKIMDINESGCNINRIIKALERMTKTDIKAKGTFYLKGKKKYINQTFHIYDTVIFKGKDLPNGQKADAIYLFLSVFYLQNINANYVMPLDWSYYLTLKNNTSKRMYEILSIYFFAALEKGSMKTQIKYSKICDFFPLTKQNNKKRATEQLNIAHKSLLNTKYFSEKPSWNPSDVPNNWIIVYSIGERAVAEWQRNKKNKRHLTIGDYETNNKLPKEKEPKPEENTDNKNIITQLVERGITKTVAICIVENYPEDFITEKINVFDFSVKNKSQAVSKNPAGWLRKSIENDFAPPEGYKTPEQQREEKIKHNKYQQQKEYRNKVCVYEGYLDAIKVPEQAVYWDLHKWKRKYKEKNGRMPTTEKIKQKEQELIKALITPEERQIQIFGKVIFKGNTLEPIS